MTQHRRANVEIDLAALKHNAKLAKQKADGASVMSAIKANAYGHGMLEAAVALKDIVDELAVASIDDVIDIRENLPECHSLPITVLSGFYRTEEIKLAVANNASLVVYDDHQIELLVNADEPVNIWLKVDTGMSRLGLKLDNLEQSVKTLESLAYVSIRGVISHFANADHIDHPLNKQQLQVFQKLQTIFQDKDWHWSIANSAALLGLSSITFDWVRPGIMLYGSSPFAEKSADQLGLKPVMTFSSEVISIRQVRQGQSVGYGSTWTAEKDTKVAVIACGYGDGYPRVIREGTPILVNGLRTKIIGRVSMDLIVVDITAIDAKIGSRVVLWGDGLSVDEIARYAGTIGYELLCSITERVERHYVRS